MSGRNLLSVVDVFDELFRGPFFNDGRSNFDFSFYKTDFPPMNLYVDEETKNLTFEFAIAGYSKEEAQVYFEDDHLHIELSKQKSTDENASKKKSLVKGIRGTSKIKTRYYVPSVKYDYENASVDFKDGILTVNIPPNKGMGRKLLTIS